MASTVPLECFIKHLLLTERLSRNPDFSLPLCYRAACSDGCEHSDEKPPVDNQKSRARRICQGGEAAGTPGCNNSRPDSVRAWDRLLDLVVPLNDRPLNCAVMYSRSFATRSRGAQQSRRGGWRSFLHRRLTERQVLSCPCFTTTVTVANCRNVENGVGASSAFLGALSLMLLRRYDDGYRKILNETCLIAVPALLLAGRCLADSRSATTACAPRNAEGQR